jgi:hypothetical protein
MKLRYYADTYDEENHEAVLYRLRRIHHVHRIDIEIERVDARHGPIEPYPGEMREADLEAVYERDFSHNRRLSANVGSPPSDAFQTNSGNKTIRGRVGIMDDGLEWATWFGGSSDEDEEPRPDRYAVDFLEDVLERGREALAERTAEPSKRTEKDVVNEFARSNAIEGEVRREPRVGESVVVDEDVSPLDPDVVETWFTRNADLIIECLEYDWVVEVKKEYGANEFDTVLGQVLVSDELYREDENLAESATKRAIVFGSNDTGFIKTVLIPGRLVAFAESHGVEVFVGDGDGEFRRLTQADGEIVP